MDILELVIENNFLLLIEELNDTSDSRSWDNLVHKEKELMKRISRYSVQYKRRMTNEAAYNLASYPKHLEDLII